MASAEARTKARIDLRTVLKPLGTDTNEKMRLFATLNLAVVEALWNRAIDVCEVITLLYDAENCEYVERKLKDSLTTEIMGRGVQLPDLFDVLPKAQAELELGVELDAMRKLCLKILRRTSRNRSRTASAH